jgi:phage terminase large subunit GpA-like protein
MPAPTPPVATLQALILLPDTVAQPGPLRLWPWQREIANAIKDPACERVTLLKPTRVGEAPRLHLAARAAWPSPPHTNGAKD